jgi:hypothetical protein
MSTSKPTVFENAVNFLQRECGVVFPITEARARQLRGIGKAGVKYLIAQGLVIPDIDEIKSRILRHESNAARFRERANIEAQKAAEVREYLHQIT